MNANYTIKGKVFNQIYSDKAESLRRSVTDGATLPHFMRIAHSQGTDKATKLPILSDLLEFKMSHLDTGGVNPSPIPLIVRVTVVHGTGLYQPSTPSIQLACDCAIQTISSTAADASAQSLRDNIFVTKEQ